jgi:hypothetical protein
MSFVNRLVRVASVWGLPAFAALLASCSGLLGIEDVSTSGSGGSAALGGNGGSGGSQNKGGSNATTGGASGVTGGSSAGGTSTTGGSPASGGATTGGKANETGGASTGGKNGTGGKTNTGGASATGGTSTGEAGEGGDGGGGGAGPTDTTVHGTIIDYYGHPVPNVPVTIGADSVQTDGQGKFTIEDVAPTYDALFVVQPMGDSKVQPYTWLYEGLTRRDPTLQVFRAFEWQYGALEYTITNGQVGNPPYTYLSVGTPNGVAYDWVSASSSSAQSLDANWAGPVSKVSGVLHALRFNSTDEEVATSFDAYYTQAVSLDASAKGTISFSMPAAAPPLTTGTVSGTVTSPTTSQRYNSVFARFADNASLPVVSGADATGEAFSYPVPSLPQAELTFAACYGYYYVDETSPLACAYQPATVGQNNLAITIPAPPALVAPAPDATGVAQDASFQWASNAPVFLFAIQDADYDYLRGVFVVTSKKQAKIPLVGGSYPLRKGFPQAWHVQVHSDVTSVDDAARPGGFLGTFAWRTAQPQIYRANDRGSFAQSVTQLASPAN